MKKIKLYLSAIFVGGLVASCNSAADNLGLQFFDADAGNGVQTSYDLIAYNVDNNDEVRADSYALTRAVLGAFSEGQFGLQNAAYVSQVRLSSYAPDLGINPVVDSVVLEIFPEYSTSVESTNTSNIIYNGQTATQVVNNYQATTYGKSNQTLTLKVKEVLDDLGSVGTEILSSKTVSEGNIIGTKSFNGKISSVSITDTNGTSLLSKEAGIRVNLDPAFFQTKIADKNGGIELASESNFISYFKGLKVYTDNTDGFMITFTPTNMVMKMYYTSGAAGSRTSSSIDFNLGSNNTRFSQISYDRTGSAWATAKNNIDVTNGDKLLYLQGMGGSGAAVKLSGTAIEELKTQYKNTGAGILSAKVRLYTDISVWNNAYPKPTGFLVKELGSSEFLTDLTSMFTNSNYSLVTAYAINSNPAYYDIDITKSVKDIVEQGGASKDLVINIGDYLTTNNSLVAEAYNSNVYSPYRVVLVGSDITNENRVKLLITSIKK